MSDLQPTGLEGLFLVTIPRHFDDRGHFFEGFNRKKFQDLGLKSDLDQVNFSFSRRPKTLRGLHYQKAPRAQTKFVLCNSGAIVDIVVDVRPESPTYLKSKIFAMTKNSLFGVYVPEGFAHGWLSLSVDCGIMYFVNGFWSKEHELGVRYDDPAVNLTLDVREANERDLSWPLIRPVQT